MEQTFNLPSSFGALDLDKQLEVFRGRMEKLTGDSEISQFVGEDAQQKLVDRYLIMSQINTSPGLSGGQIALTLLQY